MALLPLKNWVVGTGSYPVLADKEKRPHSDGWSFLLFTFDLNVLFNNY